MCCQGFGGIAEQAEAQLDVDFVQVLGDGYAHAPEGGVVARLGFDAGSDGFGEGADGEGGEF